MEEYKRKHLAEKFRFKIICCICAYICIAVVLLRMGGSI